MFFRHSGGSERNYHCLCSLHCLVKIHGIRTDCFQTLVFVYIFATKHSGDVSFPALISLSKGVMRFKVTVAMMCEKLTQVTYLFQMSQFRQPKGQPQIFRKLKCLTNKQFWDNLFLSFPPQYSDTASENLESSEFVHPLKGPLGPKPENVSQSNKNEQQLSKKVPSHNFHRILLFNQSFGLCYPLVL